VFEIKNSVGNVVEYSVLNSYEIDIHV